MQASSGVNDRSAWLGSDLAKDQSWIVTFTPAELADLDTALRDVVRKKLPLEAVDRETFPLPTLAPRLAQVLTEIQQGRGFVLLRGLQVERYSDEEAGIIYWGVGSHLGTPVRQNVAGDLLGHIRDFGKKWGDLGVRGYETNGHLIFHTDFSDMVGLLCLRPPKSGGASRIASSMTVYNELLRDHPEHIKVLHRGFRYIKRDAVDTASPVTENVPVYGRVDNVLSCRIVRERIDSAYRRIGQPLSPEETAALDAFAATAGSPRVCLDMEFRPGDMQFLNNYTVLHSRAAYQDGELFRERRHLLRLWLTSHGKRRPLAPGFPQSNGYATVKTGVPVGAVELGLVPAELS